MNSRRLSLLFAGAFAAMAYCLAQTNVPVIFPEENPLTPADYRLVWPSLPGQRYEVRQSFDLKTWTVVPGFPAVAAGPAEQLPFTAGNTPLFFQVVPLDEQPPTVANPIPSDKGFAVRRSASLTVEVTDVTRVDPASLQLTVGSLGPLTTNDSRLTFTNGVLTFAPGEANPLGSFGATVPVTLVAADTLGNRGTNTWTFTLELEPQVVTNLFVFGSSQAQSSGQRIGDIPTAALAGRWSASSTGAKPTGPRPAGVPWTLESVQPDRLVLAYTQTTPPAFTSNTYVCNLTPVTTDEIFYRKITSVSNDPARKRLTLFTVDVPLDEIATRGSAAISGDSVILETSAGGRIARMSSFDKTFTFPRVGWSLDGAKFALKGGSPAFDLVSITAKELHWWLTPQIRGGLEIDTGGLQRFEAIASGRMEFATVADLRFVLMGIAYEQVLFDLPEALEPKKTILVGFIGFVPVFATLGFDVKVKAKAEAKAELSLQWGVRQQADVAFGVKYLAPYPEWVQDFNIADLETIPFTGAIDLEGSLQTTLEPTLSFLVYGLAGFSTGIPVSDTLLFSAKEPLTDGRCNLPPASDGDQPQSGRLDVKVGLNLALAGPAFERLNFTPGRSLPLWSRSWPLMPTALAISPDRLVVDVGQPARFIFEEPALSHPSYQWYHGGTNGTPLPGETSGTLTLQRVNHGHAGIYHVRVRSGNLVIESAPATLTVGMALIQAGPFVMGDIFREDFYTADRPPYDFRNDAIPVHTVCVSAFYMDRFEVTNALWDEVHQWAVQHGYSFVSFGKGKASNHPVHTVNPHDAVKWCNARSEKEGLTSCYYTDASHTNGAAVYRSGVFDLSNANVNWDANGYRLPTEAEWEKAARGGQSGTRFSWGDTISHRQANYFGGNGIPSYDESILLHPAYATGDRPFTSPVGSFPANCDGLHDMAGNLSEWCWDWWDPSFYTKTESVLADTRGPASASNDRRVTRGGGYYENAPDLKASFRRSHNQARGNDGIGFRCVRGL